MYQEMTPMKKKLIFFLLIFITVIMSLGELLDVTQQPSKADVIVSLGGPEPSGDRIKKALVLYKNGFSNSKKICYTGGIRQYYQVWGKYLEENGIEKKISFILIEVSQIIRWKRFFLLNNICCNIISKVSFL